MGPDENPRALPEPPVRSGGEAPGPDGEEAMASHLMAKAYLLLGAHILRSSSVTTDKLC